MSTNDLEIDISEKTDRWHIFQRNKGLVLDKVTGTRLAFPP